MAGNLRIKHLDGPGRDDLPFLTGDGRHVWLHNGCHGDWTAQRRAEAVIRVQMIRQNTRHPDKLLRHPSRAWCQAPKAPHSAVEGRKAPRCQNVSTAPQRRVHADQNSIGLMT